MLRRLLLIPPAALASSENPANHSKDMEICHTVRCLTSSSLYCRARAASSASRTVQSDCNSETWRPTTCSTATMLRTRNVMLDLETCARASGTPAENAQYGRAGAAHLFIISTPCWERYPSTRSTGCETLAAIDSSVSWLMHGSSSLARNPRL